MATIRNLMKTKDCKHIVKELGKTGKTKRVVKEAAKTARTKKKKGVDPCDLKQQESVLAVSRMMISDCRERLESPLAELKGILAELEEANEKKEYGVTDEVRDAERMVAKAEKLFRTTES